MIRKISLACATLLLVSGASIAQNNKTEKKVAPVKTAYKKTANKLEYLFLKDVPGTKFIQDGSVVKMHIRTKIADSSMFDSYKMNNNEPIEQPLTKQFLGAFMEGFALLTAGDSAILRLPIDTAFKGSPMPPFAKSGDMVSYEVKIFSVKSKEEADAEKAMASKAQNGIDDKLLKEYIKTKNIKALKTASGIYYVVEKSGNGKHATAADKVKVHYKGYKLDGTTFDSSYDRGQPIEFPLSGVIKGWTEGIPLFEEGGKGTLLIPSSLAYGQNAPPGSTIKANEVLLFDVELIKINPEAEKPAEVHNEHDGHDHANGKAEASNTAACSPDPTVQDKLMQDFIKKNNLNAQKTATGLYYVIDKKGNGKHATAANQVKVHYKGTLLDGTQFDSSYDRGEPITFPLSGVIRGWTEGIPLLEEGGKGKLIIPSALAYGTNAPQGTPIKANDVLVFDVELLEIIK
jgi:FKBP-type peptidyl-prolyl cis-trans isomerase